MSDNFGVAVERVEEIIKYHESGRKNNPYYIVGRVESEINEEDPVIVNLSTLQCLLAMAKRYLKISDSIKGNFGDKYS